MDEYISREEAVKKIKSCIFTADDAWESGYNTAMAEIMEWIKHIPAADVQPVKHGQWISHGGNSYECSNCHKMIYNAKDMREHAFCGTCGARMSEV